MKTFVYRVKFDNGEAKKGAKDMQISFRSMETDSQKAKANFEKLAQTIGEKYNTSIKVMVDETRSAKAELNQLNRESNKSNRAIDRLRQEYEAMTNALGKGADEQQILNAQLRLGSQATEQQKREVRELITAYQQKRNEINKTGRSMRNFRGQMSNVGFQLQDIAVQAQMGTNAFVIMGQQGSQLAASLGPSGPLIGAGIALVSMFAGVAWSMFNAGVDAEELREKLEKLAETELLNKGDAELLAIDKAKALEDIVKEMTKVESAIQKTTIKLNQAKRDIVTMQNDGTGDFFSTIKSANKAAREQNKELRELEASLRELQRQFNSTNGEIQEYANIGAGVTTRTEKQTKAIDELVKGLNEQTLANEASKVTMLAINMARDKATAITNKATDEEIALIDAKYRALIAYELQTQAIQKEAAEHKKAMAEKAQSERELAKLRNSLHQQWLAQQSEMQARLNRLDSIKERLGVGQLNRLERQYKEEYKLLEGHTDAQKALTEEYENEKQRIQATGVEKYLFAVQDQMKNFDDLVGETVNNFTRGFGQAFAGAIMNSENLGDAMKNVFKGALTSMLAFFGEWAAQELIMWGLKKILGSTAQATEATRATFDAQAQVFMAGLNAYASTNAIPVVGPGLAPAAMKTAIATAQPLAAAVSSLKFAGAMDKGGIIPQDAYAIVSEYGDELVNGLMVKGGMGGSRVTSREDTAKMMNGNNNYITVNSSGSASPEQIANSLMRKLKKSKGNKNIDTAIYNATQRGRKNKGKRYAS